MWIKNTLFALSVSLFSLYSLNSHAEEAVPQAVIDLADSLKTWGNNPVLVAGTKAQNTQEKSLADIKKTDAEWMGTSGISPLMKSLMNSEVAGELKKLEATTPYFTEVFLMDNQGANVAMTNKTSDYWQGDEAKFKESFKGGAGAAHIGKVKFDKSAQAYLVQVSVPVMDGGKAIGAITIGVNLDELEKAGK